MPPNRRPTPSSPPPGASGARRTALSAAPASSPLVVFLLLTLLPILAASQSGCARDVDLSAATARDETTDLPARPPVGREGPAPLPFVFTGELRAVRGEEIRAPQAPTMPIQIKWMAPEGSEVAAGEPILEFDNAAILAKLEEQKLAWRDAGSRLRSSEARIAADRAEKSFAVERARIEEEKATLEASIPEEMRPRREFEEKRLALVKARAAHDGAQRTFDAFEIASRDEVEILRIEVDKAERSVRSAEESLAQLSLKAPRPGVLVYGDHPWEGRKFQVGDDTWPRMTVETIPDLTEMEVLGWLSDVDDGEVAQGQRVDCILDTYPDRVFPGRIREIAALAETRSRDNTIRGFDVVIDLDRSDPLVMRPGMSVRIEAARPRR